MQVASPLEQLFFTTVRIETQADEHLGAGTGFFFGHSVEGGQYLFVVSNKHVVIGAKRATMLFTLREGEQPRLGHKFTVTLENFSARWFGHRDAEIDVAVMPLAPLLREIENKTGQQVYFKAVGDELIPDRAATEELDAIEEVTFLGYPNGMYDTVNLTPIARKGITATPVALDYDGRKAFLIDASVFPGSSGSPVFIINSGSYTRKSGGVVIGSRLFFLGVLSGVFFHIDEAQIEMVEIPTAARVAVARTEQMIDLGFVYKADTVSETISQFLETAGAC